MRERMQMHSGYEREYAIEPRDVSAGITSHIINRIEQMQDQSRVIVERLGRLGDQLLGPEPKLTGERVCGDGIGMNKTVEMSPRGSLGEIQARVDDLSERLNDINYFLGRLE